MKNPNEKELKLISNSLSGIEKALQAHRELVKKTGIFNYILDLGGLFLICVLLSAFGVISLTVVQTISFSISGSVLMILAVQMHLARFKAEGESYNQKIESHRRELEYQRKRMEELEESKPKID